MSLRNVYSRLVLAIAVPVVLVTVTLYTIIRGHLDAQLDAARFAAEATLDAGRESLYRGMNVSFNHVLATAEIPTLERYLSHVGEALSPLHEEVQHRTAEQLESLLETLLRHYGSYTKLVLIDTQGNELLKVYHDQQHAPEMATTSHANTDYFREAMTLSARDLYLSPPGHNLHYESRNEGVVPVVNITTPVFDAQGERKGVLLFSLDWQYLTRGMKLAMSINGAAEVILVNELGNMLSSPQEPLRLGGHLAAESPDLWEALSRRNRGEADLGDRLALFQTVDIRTQHYRNQAGKLHSLREYHPWRMGIIAPKPSLRSLLSQSGPQIIVALLYGLSIAFGVFWALSSHRQRNLRRDAQQYADRIYEYATEVRNLYEHAPCGYHSLDADGRIVKMNHTELDWLGYRADEVVDTMHYQDLVTSETREAFAKAFQNVLGPNREGSAECELRTRYGTTIPVAIQATAYTAKDGFVYSRAMVFDLTERKQLEEALARQAMTDPLTGLGNRRYLQEQAAMEMARAKRSGEPLSLIAIDLDHFKRINDDYGHDVGDLVLQAFAATAKQLLRDGDVVCRVGGEEFAVLLPNTSKAQAMQVAERFRGTLTASPVQVGPGITKNGWITYTASLGVTLILADEPSLKPAIKRADIGLYAAKEAGRNRVHWQAA